MNTNHRFADLAQRGLGAPRVVAIGRLTLTRDNGGGEPSGPQVTAPTDWPTPEEIEEICERLRYMDKFAAAIRALMDDEDFEKYLGYLGLGG